MDTLQLHRYAQVLAGQDAKALKRMCAFAHDHRHEPDHLEAIAEGYGRKVEPMILAVEAMPQLFGRRTYRTDTYLSLLAILRQNKFNRPRLLERFADEIVGNEVELALVQKEIEDRKAKREKKPPLATQLKDAREIIELLCEMGDEFEPEDLENAMSLANSWMEQYGGKA